MSPVPLIHADLEFHGYPLKIEGNPAGNVQYVYEKTSATGPYTRPAGTYTRYGDVLPLLTATDDKLAVFGCLATRCNSTSIRLPPALPKGWWCGLFLRRQSANKDMDFYAAEGNYVAPCRSLAWVNIRIRPGNHSRSTMRT